MPIDLNSHFHSFQAFQTLSLARFLSRWTLLSLPTSFRVYLNVWSPITDSTRISNHHLNGWKCFSFPVFGETLCDELDRLLNTLKRLSQFDSVRHTQPTSYFDVVCVLRWKKRKENDGSLGLTITRYIESALPKKEIRSLLCTTLSSHLISLVRFVDSTN